MEKKSIEVLEQPVVLSISDTSMRAIIEKEISKRQAEVDGLRVELARAESALSALKDLLKKIPQDKSHDGAAAEGGARKPQPTLRAGTDLAGARRAILGAGKPLHVTDILRILGKENTKSNRVSLVGSLGTYVRKEQIFNRPAPNVFGLIEMDTQEVQGSLPIAS